MLICDCRQSSLCLPKTNDGASLFSVCRHLWLTDGAASAVAPEGQQELRDSCRDCQNLPGRTSQAEQGCWLPLKNHIKLQLSKVFVKATSMIQATLSSGKELRKLYEPIRYPSSVP